MTLPRALARSLADLIGGEVQRAHAVGGGSINDAWRVEAPAGTLFVKSRPDATAEDFAMEAAGLRWLRAGGAAAPAVIAHGASPAFLALEWIEPGRLSAAGAEELGRSLAALHRTGAETFGALPPGAPDSILRLGSVEVELSPADGWVEAYAGQLVLPLARRAVDAGRLTSHEARVIEAACGRLADTGTPTEPPARLHGDLWSGNVLAGASGSAWLIDPAAYGGHREVDLAMLDLFGAPSPRILSAYAEEFPLADGYRDRAPLWQVLPLLVHAILFGGGYGASAARAAVSST